MAGRNRNGAGPTRNKAQEERAAADEEPKKFADTAQLGEPETWAHPAGHSGTRRAWVISIGMLAAFLLAGGGFTFGPRVLLWVGVAVFVVLGVLSFAIRVWTDYVGERRHIKERKRANGLDQ